MKEPLSPKNLPSTRPSGARGRRVDFLLIGAQKSGTTSLWQHVAAHPATFVPATKEVEFFSHPERYLKGVDWYLNTFFAAAPKRALKGEATTQYMMFPEVPPRIHHAFPDIKLIALLRNPIDRAFSHYRMTFMRGHESRSFEEAVEAQLHEPSSGPIDPDKDYLRLGEYGRILDNFLEHFPREQLCVVFTERLDAEPLPLVREVYAFLGIDPQFHPMTIDKRFNVGGMPRFGTGAEVLRRAAGKLRRTPIVGRLISQDRYEAFKFWTRTELQVRVSPGDCLDESLRTRLAEHFLPDVERLRRSLDVETPWPDFESGADR